MEETLLARFIARFQGLTRAYGVYQLNNDRVPGKKHVGAVRKTLRENVTEQLWIDHLEGTQGVGIIPINDDSEVRWGCIDVDEYAEDHHTTVRKVGKILKKFDYPLIPVCTKSGGTHIFCFTNEPVPASLMKSTLKKIAHQFGFTEDTEVFPKQSRLLASHGDVGQWLNMPYFDHKNTVRYAYINDAPLSLVEFLDLADSLEIDSGALVGIGDGLTEDRDLADPKSDDPIKAGPPCLQTLVATGFPEGTRNNGLYNIGVYLKKRNPKDWKELLPIYNMAFMKPPLQHEDINGIIRSLDRNDYSYKCDDIPICDVCNKNTCVNRKFGVSDLLSNYPEMTNLVKLLTEPPQYFLDVNGARVGPMPYTILSNQGSMRIALGESVDIVLHRIKDSQYDRILKKLIDGKTDVEMPDDASEEGQLFEHLRSYSRSRTVSTDKEDLAANKPIVYNGEFLFKLTWFQTYLEQQRFKVFNANKISALFRKRGMDTKVVRSGSRVHKLWFAPFEDEEIVLKSPEQAQAPF